MHQHKIFWFVFLKAGKHGLTVEIDMKEKLYREKEMGKKIMEKREKNASDMNRKRCTVHTHSHCLFHTNYKESALSTE